MNTNTNTNLLPDSFPYNHNYKWKGVSVTGLGHSNPILSAPGTVAVHTINTYLDEGRRHAQPAREREMERERESEKGVSEDRDNKCPLSEHKTQTIDWLIVLALLPRIPLAAVVPNPVPSQTRQYSITQLATRST